MAKTVKTAAYELPTTPPIEAIGVVIDVVNGQKKLSELLPDALKALHQTLGYLLKRYLDERAKGGAEALALKANRPTPAKIAAALEELRGAAGVQSIASYAWLIPVLLKLGKQWLETKG